MGIERGYGVRRCETAPEITRRLTDATTAILRNAVERRRALKATPPQ